MTNAEMEIECIDLSDEEDIPGRNQRNSSRRVPTECLNVDCLCDEEPEYIDGVPAFILSYYKVRRRKGLKVCCRCFQEACTYFNELKTKFLTGESIYQVPPSRYKPVLNIDSDEEDLSSDEEVKFNEESMRLVKNELPSIFKKVLTSDNVLFQVNDSYNQLKKTFKKFEEEQKQDLHQLKILQEKVDAIRNKIYKPFQPTIQQLPELQIDDVWKPLNENGIIRVEREWTPVINGVNQNGLNNTERRSQDVIAVAEEISTPPPTLPPPDSPITRPKLKLHDTVYVMRQSCKHAWKKGSIVGLNNEKGFNEYEVKIEAENRSYYRAGKYVAYTNPCEFRYTAGVRVIAQFKDESYDGIGQFQYFSGIVAEPPKAVNKFRYLIFFDDHCTQYVYHEQIRLIYDPSKNPWEDVPLENRDFIKKYLIKYPERPMVKLQVGNVIEVEFKSNWLQGKVMQIDGSLAKMYYLNLKQNEWIYRGSSRLKPLLKEFQAAKYRMQTGHRGRIVTESLRADAPYVEYTRGADGEVVNDENVPLRAIARKSVSGVNKLVKMEEPVKWDPLPIPGRLIEGKLVNAKEPKKFFAHHCGPSCIQWTGYKFSEAKGRGPLAIPLHFGFRRIIGNFGDGKHVMYKAPCGRSLRNMDEVHAYLRITNSDMTVDFFDYDHWVNVLSEFVIDDYNYSIDDISNGKERVPINCINYIDSDVPNCRGYLTERMPRDNVGLNLDPNFLCGCDCNDDCQDREKCSCWQMTNECQKLIPNNIIDPNVGYNYRRLPERVLTGIYECNQNCKCSKLSCLNRVVQYPLSQKLQIYKTEKKGWGIRCLTDIPQGAFICVYAGHLLTEQEANEEGKTYGDEYFAELDYIEVIERIKEGYESDVPEDLEEDLKEVRTQATENDCSYQTSDSSSSSSYSDDIGINESFIQNKENTRYKLRERKTRPPPALALNNTKKKKDRKEFKSIRKYYGHKEDSVYIMDAKTSGNIGRYLNHSCMPNVFVQNVFVDTHDLRFPWVAFFAQTYIIAGTELTWDYNYDIGSVENREIYCYCLSSKCRKRLL